MIFLNDPGGQRQTSEGRKSRVPQMCHQGGEEVGKSTSSPIFAEKLLKFLNFRINML